MSHKHCNEIKRWADSPEGTKVWCKQTIKWVLYNAPSWSKKFQHIVDDCHAELRKRLVDFPGTEFEYKIGNSWMKVDEPIWDSYTEYRVKEEPKTATYY